MLVSRKFKNPGERFDWSVDRVAVGKCVMRLAVKTCAEIGFIISVVNSSMTIVNTRSNQSSTRRFDNANSFFRVQRGLNSKSRWNKAEIFAAVVEPELLFYTSDVSCVTDVIVSKFFALTPKGT